MSVVLSQHVEALAAIIADRLGLAYEPGRAPLDEILRARIAATHARDADGYLAALGADPSGPAPSRPDDAGVAGELAELARRITVGETYFFRNRDHFHAFATLLERWQDDPATRGTRLRVLSAGCASGEEPYSLAMVALDSTSGTSVSLTACDTNPDAIERALAGRYSAWSLRDMPAGARERYLVTQGASFEVDRKVRQQVHFQVRNLGVSDPTFFRPGAFDIIFCRNVLMYFTADAAGRCVQRLVGALTPRGHLFLGHAETLRGLTRALPEPLVDIELTTIGAAFVYRRGEPTDVAPSPALAPAAPPALDAGWFEAIGRAHERVLGLARPSSEPARSPPVERLDEALALLARERYQDALALVPDGPTLSSEARLVRAVLLVQTGDFSGAEATCRPLVAGSSGGPASPALVPDAGAAYLIGLCREQAGDIEGAVRHYRAAVECDATFAMPRLHLGLLSRRAGDRQAEQRELAVARELFVREEARRLTLFASGFGRDALIAMCESGPRRGGQERA